MISAIMQLTAEYWSGVAGTEASLTYTAIYPVRFSILYVQTKKVQKDERSVLYPVKLLLTSKRKWHILLGSK